MLTHSLVMGQATTLGCPLCLENAASHFSPMFHTKDKFGGRYIVYGITRIRNEL